MVQQFFTFIHIGRKRILFIVFVEIVDSKYNVLFRHVVYQRMTPFLIYFHGINLACTIS